MSGLTAMTIGLFLFTSLHDITINVATLLGLVALGGTFIGLEDALRKILYELDDASSFNCIHDKQKKKIKEK